MAKNEKFLVSACPFCGSFEVDVHKTSNQIGSYFVVECSDCWATGPIANSERLAWILWNMDYKDE